ncbi:MAG: NUDIX hydrolase, partial [Planctomycetales bacterium]|nr:NUDIX hydrolase [Planctomycetales bacterium]
LLQRYAAERPEQRDVAERIANLVRSHADCFDRTCRPGHITGSAWVTTPQRDRFLLVHHAKLEKWLQPGGHADGEHDVAGVALREAREESGIDALKLATCETRGGALPYDLDVHVIPARFDREGQLLEDAHEHHDVRFLILGDAAIEPCVSVESHAAGWFTADEVRSLTQEESVLRMLRRSLSEC